MKPLPPSPPRPPHRDTLPPSVKRHVSEHGLQISDEIHALARVLTQINQTANSNHDAHTRQISAMHAHQIEMHAWLHRQAQRRLWATFFGAALGAAAAIFAKGFL